MGWALLAVVAGLIVLVLGGELLVRGASRIAALAGVSPLVVGLTVVAFGTSSPELAVSLKASFSGQPDIAVGNIVGSNIFNVLLILGVSALITPLVVSIQLIRVDVPIMVAASVALWVLGLDGRIGRVDGLLLFVGLLCYTGWSLHQSRKEVAARQRDSENAADAPPFRIARFLSQASLILVGLALLTVGAECLVSGSAAIARILGMSELMIGLTIIAAGTSLPEVAASIVASIKGERDIAVGNVVGSNIFNIMCVGGLSAIASTGGLEVSQTAIWADIPIMMAVAVACLPVFFTGHVIARWEGGLFLAYYVAYMTYLVLAVSSPTISRTFGGIMLGFVVPLTIVTLMICVAREWRQSRQNQLARTH